MYTNQFHISNLIAADVRGTLDASAQKELQDWINSSEENKTLYLSLTTESTLKSKLQKYNEGNLDAVWNKTMKRVTEESAVAVRPNAKLYTYKKIVAIAAAVATVTLGVWLYYIAQTPNVNHNPETAHQIDIAPGSQGATLTLSNGKRIALNGSQTGLVVAEDQLAYMDGSTVDEDEKSAIHNDQLTATTSKGQTYIFKLPDGTKVWLNADSKISFAQQFTKKTREVFLEGEAYFEVAKDKRHPFIVSSKGQQIEVLGTHFNVNSYKDEPVTATTLLEGSVKIKAGKEQRVIRPGQQTINANGSMSTHEVDVENVVDWKNGDFYLNHVEFKTAMRKIARWYDMEIVYDETVPDNMESGGWIARDKPLSAVLKSIESSGLVKFKIAGRKIYVRQ